MNNKTVGYRIFLIINTLVMIFVGIITLFPFLNVLALALNDAADSMSGGIWLIPRQFTLSNIQSVLSSRYIKNAFAVSVLRVIAGTGLGLFVQFCAAYVLNRKNVPGKKFMLMFLTIPMFLNGGVIANYILYARIDMLNTFWVYIIPTAFSFYNVIIIRTYLNTIPESLIESATLDGAGEMRTLLRIVVPLSMPILATIALWLAVGHWNDYSTTLYYASKKSNIYTLQYILMQMVKDGERVQKLIQEAAQNGQSNIKVTTTPEAQKASQIIVTTLPIVCVYPFLQKYFVKGVMIGSVKE